MTFRKVISTVAVYAFLALGAIIALAPFLLSAMTAFKTPKQFANQGSTAIPDPWTTENFAALFGRADFGRAFLVTALVTIVITVFQLGFSVMAAYAFARIDFAGRNALFWLYLSGLMVPQLVLIVPLYLMLTAAGLVNTFWALVLPFLFASPYAVFLLREYFRGIPQDLVDAARIDGAGHWRILTRIIVPLSKPILATLVLITAVSQWNSFLWPLVITSGSKWRVLTVATSNMQSQFNGNWTLVMAATTLALVPLLVIFLIFQKQIVRSIAITGFK